MAPADVPAIVARCAAAYELAMGRTVPRAGLQLLNSAPDPEGTRYLLYGPDVYVSCQRLTYGDYVASGTAGQTRWMRAPLSADGSGGTSAPNDQGPGTWRVEGRVAAAVTEVELRFGSSRVTVPAVNGTFMATVTVDSPELARYRPRVRALGRAGRVLYGSPTTGSSPVPDTRCWVAPDGTVLKGDVPPEPGQKCLPAMLWR